MEQSKHEDVIKKQRQQIEELQKELGKLGPDVKKLDEIFSTFNLSMSPEISKMNETAEGLKKTATQLQGLAEFLASPEAKRAYKRYDKD